MADTSALSSLNLDTTKLGLDPRFGSLQIDAKKGTFGGKVNWIVVVVIVVLVVVCICSSCSSLLYFMRDQIMDLINPKTVQVEGYNYKGREIPDEYSGY